MKTIDDVKRFCRVDYGDDGLEHWFWQGAHFKGGPFIRAPNFTADPSGKTSTTQRGRRAVWHLLTGKPILAGFTVYSTCGEISCVNPNHLVADTPQSHGQALVVSGARKAGVLRRLAGQRGAASFRKITPNIANTIFDSNEPTRDLAMRYGVHISTINRYRSGRATRLGGLFSGLLR